MTCESIYSLYLHVFSITKASSFSAGFKNNLFIVHRDQYNLLLLVQHLLNLYNGFQQAGDIF